MITTIVNKKYVHNLLMGTMSIFNKMSSPLTVCRKERKTKVLSIIARKLKLMKQLYNFGFRKDSTKVPFLFFAC